MKTTLDEYVTRYYVRWLVYAKYLCNAHGMRREDAYDLFAASLLDLLVKDAATIDELLACEAQGEKKLFYYTKKIILYNVLQGKQQGYRFPCYAGDNYIFETTGAADDALLECDESIFNSAREIEAEFRDDTFCEPIPQLELPAVKNIKVGTSIYVWTPKTSFRKNGNRRVWLPFMGEVYYTDNGKRRVKTKKFPSREEARMWTKQCKAEILAGVLTV